MNIPSDECFLLAIQIKLVPRDVLADMDCDVELVTLQAPFDAEAGTVGCHAEALNLPAEFISRFDKISQHAR